MAPEESIGVGIGTELRPDGAARAHPSLAPLHRAEPHSRRARGPPHPAAGPRGPRHLHVGLGDRRLLLGAPRDRRTAPNGVALVLRLCPASCSGPGPRAGCRSCTTTPRRSAPTASPTPSGPTTSTAARAWWSTWAPRRRWRPSAPTASTWVAPSRPAWASASTRSYQSAAALRRVELVEPRSVIGRSTVESIESGTLYGFAGLVDSLARRFMEELGPATVVATGGFSSLIAPYSDTIEHVEPWLTLHGLRIVYERNVPFMSEDASTGRVAVGVGDPLPLRPHARDSGRRRRPGRRSPRARSPASPSGWPAASCCCAIRARRPSASCVTHRARIQLFARAAVTERLRGVRQAESRRLGRRYGRGRARPGAASSRSWSRSGCCWPRRGATSATSGTA